ncbi:MAG: hypothetical protein WC289_05795 [Patescibacteria group bacterium]|jgi:DNA polymerase-4
MKYSPLKTILCVKIDDFIPSAIEALRPDLRNTPFVVRNRQSTFPLAINKAARQLGMNTGTSVEQMQKSFSSVQIVEPEMKKIGDFANEFISILKRFSGKIELLGFDEAYIDMTGYEHLWIAPQYLAINIIKSILHELEMDAHIGIASTKTCASIAARRNERNGFTVVPVGDEAKFISSAPIELLPGIGGRTSSILRRMGISSIGDLAKTPMAACTETFGPVGHTLWSAANGFDPRTVEDPRETRSISKSIAMTPKIAEYVDRRIDRIIDRLYGKIKLSGHQFRTAVIQLHMHDGKVISRQQTYRLPLVQKQDMHTAYRILIQSISYKLHEAKGITFRVLRTESLPSRTPVRLPASPALLAYTTAKKPAEPIERELRPIHEKTPNYQIDFRGFVMEGSLP